MPRIAFVAILALGATFSLPAAPLCIAGKDLASYVALGAGGCTIGPLLVNNFTFNVVSSGGGDIPIGAADITVTPTFGADFVGALFSSTGFSVTANQFVNYLIGYTWDPTGDIRGLGDVLDPGSVDILTNGCAGAAFSGAVCSGTAVSVHVFEDATTQLTDFVAFAPTSIVGIRNNISLNANGASASFMGIENDVYLPEPAGFLTAGAGVVLLAAISRRALMRQSRNFRLQLPQEQGGPPLGKQG